MKSLWVLGFMLFGFSAISQDVLVSDPEKAAFVTTDILNFWEAFDQMDLGKKAFQKYIDKGSEGLKGFIPYRIESAKNLYKVVKSKKADYEKIRPLSLKVMDTEEDLRKFYQKFKSLYPTAKFPPAYFVIGAFNSGGTISDKGVIIGVEMQKDVAEVPYIVAHELVHFNQHYTNDKNTLLSQSISEGSADFVGELISGKHINQAAWEYGNRHEEELCKEFVQIMDDKKYHGWLYGSSGKKKGRPNDLGYWIGYQICKTYCDKQENKAEALSEILNISNFKEFLKASGYLDKYL